jgi:energy-converting hydrogenase Eha subunit A
MEIKLVARFFPWPVIILGIEASFEEVISTPIYPKGLHPMTGFFE